MTRRLGMFAQDSGLVRWRVGVVSKNTSELKTRVSRVRRRPLGYQGNRERR